MPARRDAGRSRDLQTVDWDALGFGCREPFYKSTLKARVKKKKPSTRRRSLARYLRLDLLIIDDMGMKQLPKRSGEYPSRSSSSLRTRRTTTTSNRPLEDWGKLLGDVPSALANLDRPRSMPRSSPSRAAATGSKLPGPEDPKPPTQNRPPRAAKTGQPADQERAGNQATQGPHDTMTAYPEPSPLHQRTTPRILRSNTPTLVAGFEAPMSGRFGCAE